MLAAFDLTQCKRCTRFEDCTGFSAFIAACSAIAQTPWLIARCVPHCSLFCNHANGLCHKSTKCAQGTLLNVMIRVLQTLLVMQIQDPLQNPPSFKQHQRLPVTRPAHSHCTSHQQGFKQVALAETHDSITDSPTSSSKRICLSWMQAAALHLPAQ